jgi:hypothetical protein
VAVRLARAPAGRHARNRFCEDVTRGVRKPGQVSPSNDGKPIQSRIVDRIVRAGIIPEGKLIRFVPPYDRSQSRLENWLKEFPERGTAFWHNDAGRPLEWSADGNRYSPTALARKIVKEATGVTLGALRGTAWWTVEGRTLVEIAPS